MEIIHTIFGQGKDLTVLNMASRAIIIFFITLIFIRIAGMRTFAKKSAFDDIIVIMLGAVLSRPIVGASAFLPTIVAAFILVLIHKLLAIVSFNSPKVAELVKGEYSCLFKDGEYIWRNMKRSCLSKDDILEEIRACLNESGTDKVKEIFLERGGKISVIKKQE